MNTSEIYLLVPEADFHNLTSCTRFNTPEENAIMLMMGSQCMELLRSNKLKLGNDSLKQTIAELERKIMFLKDHYKECIQEWEERLDVQAEKLAEEKIRAKDQYINDLKDTIDNQLLEIIEYKTNMEVMENRSIISLMNKETQKRLEQFDNHLEILNSATNKLSLFHNSNSFHEAHSNMHVLDMFQDIVVKAFVNGFTFSRLNNNDSNIGKLTFPDWAVCFQVHNTDFPIFKEHQDEFKKALQESEEQVGWFISLNSNIKGQDDFPITVEWISCMDEDDNHQMKCILYVNKLSFTQQPEQIIRISWNYSQTLLKLMKTSSNALTELSHQVFEKKIIETMNQLADIVTEEGYTINEMNKQLNLLKESNKKVKEIIHNSLNEKTQDFLTSSLFIEDKKIQRIRSWLNTILVQKNDAPHYITCNEIWEKFKQYNKLDMKMMRKKEMIPILTHILHAFIVQGTELNPSFNKHIWSTIKSDNPHIEITNETENNKVHHLAISQDTAYHRITSRPIRRLNGTK